MTFILLIFSAFMAPTWASPPTHRSIESAEWRHIANRHHDAAGNITVWNTEVSGTQCYKGMTTTKGDPKVMLDVVSDIVGTIQWSGAGVTEAKRLFQSKNKIDFYQFLDVPTWTMANDRQLFLTADIERKPHFIGFRWSRLHIDKSHPYWDFYSGIRTKHPESIEPPVNVGGWYFSKKASNVEVSYVVCTDAGGVIPEGIQNEVTKRTLPDNLGDMLREAKKRSAR